MIVDSSAIIAIATDEPGSDLYLQTLLASRARRVSAATLLEAAIVVDRHPSPLAAPKFEQQIGLIRFVVEPFTASQAALARGAYQRFGKGSGHPAQLNFGDCFTYALAKEIDEPVLFVGQDFVHTDVQPAILVTLDPFEEEELQRSSPALRRWYYQIRAFILGLGDDVEARPRHRYVPFHRLGRQWRQTVFANANFRPSENRLVIDIPKLEQQPPFDGEFLLPWEGEQKRDKVVHVVIDSDDDVERAKSLIRQSYHNLD